MGQVTGSHLSVSIALSNLTQVFVVFLAGVLLYACSYPVTMHSPQGERLTGKYRYGGEGRGLIQVTGTQGETLLGRFIKVDRTTFVNDYEKAFGRGAIDWDGPDLSNAGHVFLGLFGTSYVAAEAASAEKFTPRGEKRLAVITGPLFYWTAFLESDRRTSMQCYLIGSAYTGKGIGRCKGDEGREYSVEF